MLFAIVKEVCRLKGYMTLKEASEKWGLSVRWINVMCSQNRIPGAEMIGKMWVIPENTECPDDRRIRTGKYKSWREKYGKYKKLLKSSDAKG